MVDYINRDLKNHEASLLMMEETCEPDGPP